MPEPILIVGLGNPGFEYDDTRHNVGFMVADELSLRHRSIWKPGKGDYLQGRFSLDDRDVVLLKPLTYMNNSGEAVVEALERFAVPVRNLIAVVDDIAFALGTIRVRAKGTDGGHNGLRSLIYHLNTVELARIRCGIGTGQQGSARSMAEFVLSPFAVGERGTVEEMVRRAADAAEEFVRSGIERTMTMYNTNI